MDWANRALNHARLLTSATPGRGSATRLEAQAAEYVRKHLAGIGLANLHVQPFTGSRSIWFFLALAFGVAIMGHIAFALLPVAIGRWPAWGVSTLLFGASFLFLFQKFTFRSPPFEDLLPSGPSQNVVAVIPPVGETHRKIVLVSHLDSHRAVIWFATDLLVSLYGLISPIVIFGSLAAPILYALLILTGLGVFGWLGVALAFLQFLAWFTGVTADLGVYSPGANDNAAAVGTVLALAERLQHAPLQNTEVTCLFTGCEESGCDGLRTFLREKGSDYRQALFVDFELVGIGERLIYLQAEGIIRRRRVAPAVERLVAGVPEQEISPWSWGRTAGFTETGAAWEYGFQGVCLMMLRAGSNLLPEWHRMSDTPDKLSRQALQKTHAYAWALMQTYDAQGLEATG